MHPTFRPAGNGWLSASYLSDLIADGSYRGQVARPYWLITSSRHPTPSSAHPRSPQAAGKHLLIPSSATGTFRRYILLALPRTDQVKSLSFPVRDSVTRHCAGHRSPAPDHLFGDCPSDTAPDNRPLSTGHRSLATDRCLPFPNRRPPVHSPPETIHRPPFAITGHCSLPTDPMFTGH